MHNYTPGMHCYVSAFTHFQEPHHGMPSRNDRQRWVNVCYPKRHTHQAI